MMASPSDLRIIGHHHGKPSLDERVTSAEALTRLPPWRKRTARCCSRWCQAPRPCLACAAARAAHRVRPHAARKRASTTCR
eukprot:scaffold5178_cov364-Prasinococcus_capsulatus_cf.AAC.13